MTIDAHDLTFRLIGTQLPPGQLGLADVADICRALQDLNTKISRLVAGQRAGRTGEATARVARLRITSIGVGSTKLGVGYGETNALPDPELSTLEEAISEKFWEIIAGMTTGVRPDWAPEGVARSTLELGDALAHAAKRVEVRRADHRHVRFEAKFFVREPWQASDETVTVEGELTAVDLDSHRFRIRDDAGNAIPLMDVQNQDTAARLIAGRATATGLAVRGRRGELKALTAAIVSPSTVPALWRPSGRLRRRPEFTRQRPDWEPIEGLTDEESDRFMAAISE